MNGLSNYFAEEHLREMYGEKTDNQDEDFFPLPEFLVFSGYTLILFVDKVLFDTQALFDENSNKDGEGFADPVDQ